MNIFAFIEACWIAGDINKVSLKEDRKVLQIATVEECQYQCQIAEVCIHFKFDQDANECWMYGENAMDHFEYYDPLLSGPKKCKGNLNFITFTSPFFVTHRNYTLIYIRYIYIYKIMYLM